MNKIRDNRTSEDHIILDLKELNNNFSIKVCSANYSSARTPLYKHSHGEMTEITFVLKGKQVYIVNNQSYVVNSGEVFITHPYEEHSSGSYPEDKSILCYILIDLEKHKNDVIGFAEEGDLIVQKINNIEKRVFRGNSNLKVLHKNICNLYNSNHQYKQTLIKNYISQFLINIYDCAEKAAEHNTQFNIKIAIDYINANLNENIKIETLAQMSRLSVSRFKANFSKQVGLPPHEYILRQKVELIKNILITTDQSITEIAYDMSFSSSQHLSMLFKKFTSKTPKEYRLTKANI